MARLDIVVGYTIFDVGCTTYRRFHQRILTGTVVASALDGGTSVTDDVWDSPLFTMDEHVAVVCGGCGLVVCFFPSANFLFVVSYYPSL